MIIGTDLMVELGIRLNFQDACIEWDEASMPFKDKNSKVETSLHIEDVGAVQESTTRMKRILDATYTKADLSKIVTECTQLSNDEQAKLLQLLERHKPLFDGTLGYWNHEEYDIELQADAKPYHARAYPIPKVHEQTLRTEIERLCSIGVLRKVNRSEWAAPTFIIPKKDGTVRFISDFRELNKRIKRKPFPIPKIQDLLLKLEGFRYATSLDLNMGYYHIELSPYSQQLCTIVLPWGKYEYLRLPMGLANSPDIFQEKMSTLMDGLEFVRTYLDDCLILTTGSWDDHLSKLEMVLVRLQAAGLKVNAKKSFFGKDQLEYLGYWITRSGIQPLPKKVEAIKNIAVPKTRKQLRSFIGMVNYYRDMWIHRSDALAPLTALTSKTTRWVWTPEHQAAFDRTKSMISREVLLAFPDFSQPFEIHTDASALQLGAVVAQNNKPIAFFSRKLNPAQTRYTTTERELLAIVETLKEFRTILLGQKIRVYTDHKNLTCANFNTDRVMRWRLILEEYGPELIYIKGTSNIVADALSRLTMTKPTADIVEKDLVIIRDNNAHICGLEKQSSTEAVYAFPLTFNNIKRAQRSDSALLDALQSKDDYTQTIFRGGGKTYELIVRDKKIVIPKNIQRRVVEWYHEYLCHPGETRTEQTIRQHYWWNNLRKTVHDVCTKCHTCQLTKKGHMKYGKLPKKEAEAIPWDVLCIDLIGPYTIERKSKAKKPLTLWALTMIDPATGWFEMREIQTKKADVVANVLEQAWLTRYPWPTQMIFDRGSEFKAEMTQMLKTDYGIKVKAVTTRNPQANAIVERIHQTIGNMIRTFEIYDNDGIDDDDPWSGILAAVMAAVRSTYATTMQATPMQLVFGRDAVINTKFIADWDYIRQRKQNIIHQNNIRENAKRTLHTYTVGDKVMMKRHNQTKYGGPQYEGPYAIVTVNDNGTVRIKRRAFYDTINIRNVKPYFD
jgi:transposase InsO family protein